MTIPLKVLFVAAEVAPFAKVGGLADVAGALPKALAALGHDVRVVTPRHATASSAGTTTLKGEVLVNIKGRVEKAAVHEAALDHTVPVYMLENEGYFGRQGIYGEPDDAERFLFFSLAAPQVALLLGWQPDVIHAHDWHAAASLKVLHDLRRSHAAYTTTAGIYTIHNLQYQGHFGLDWLLEALPDNHDGIVEALASVKVSPSMMALGILSADAITTVSETYAREVLTPEYGFGLDGLLRQRSADVHGIINGIDYDVYDPATDRFLAANFDARLLERRTLNKIALQERARLPLNPDVPLLGMVSRLADQKGLDILATALPVVLDTLDIQLVMLGTGEAKYHHLFRDLASRYPSKLAFCAGFDQPLGQLIYGGCDVFLMPSRFEPCGLGQLIAMRYGAIPLVRSTGGLADTVSDCGPDLERGNGFVFSEYSDVELAGTIRRAAEAFHNKAEWQRLMARVMGLDFSWGASARKYERLYRQAIEKARQSP